MATFANLNRRTAALAVGLAATLGLAPQWAPRSSSPPSLCASSPLPGGGGPRMAWRAWWPTSSPKPGASRWWWKTARRQRLHCNRCLQARRQDGHDLIVLDNVHLAAYPSLFKKLPYDTAKDFDPCCRCSAPTSSSPWAPTAPTRPWPMWWPTPRRALASSTTAPWSVGNPVHLGSELFESMTGTQMEHVIFKETTQLYTSVSTGDINFAMGSAATAGPLYRAGKLRLLALAAPQRSPEFPDVPTVAESGGPKDFAVTGWNAIAVPPGLPAAVTDKIQARHRAGADRPRCDQEKFKTFGYESFPTTRAQFDQFVKDEAKRFGDVIRQANVSLD